MELPKSSVPDMSSKVRFRTPLCGAAASAAAVVVVVSQPVVPGVNMEESSALFFQVRKLGDVEFVFHSVSSCSPKRNWCRF